jgi:hypothetical protein
MAALRPLVREASIAFYRWALAEISPTHEDVPYIVNRLHTLMAERHQQTCFIRRIEWL